MKTTEKLSKQVLWIVTHCYPLLPIGWVTFFRPHINDLTNLLPMLPINSVRVIYFNKNRGFRVFWGLGVLKIPPQRKHG
jgi:hypothetical protein